MKLLIVAFVAATTALAGAQDWNQWRGPSRDGIATAFTPPAAWPARATQVWKVPAGLGHSSPVVSGNRVFLFSRIGDQEALTAYDLATGKQVWRQGYDAPYQVNPAAASHGKGPKSTPLVHGGRVFTFGIAGTLSAFDAKSGAVVWRKNFGREFGETSPEYGASMSPAAADGTIVLQVGGKGSGAVSAFDAATGAVRWTWKGDGPGYASPIVATLAGVRQVITQTQSHVVGLAAADGGLLWQVPFATEYDQNIITPVVAGDTVIYSGVAQPVFAIRIAHATGKWTATEVWRNPDVPMYMSSPVVVEGTLYGFTHRNKGQFFALDAATGRLLWTSEGRQGDNAALVSSGPWLIATTTEGEIVAARRSAKSFEVAHRYTVADSPVWAHPAPAGRGILVKDAETLAYWTF